MRSSKDPFEPSSRLCLLLLLALPVVLFWPALVGGKMLWGADIQTLALPFNLSARHSLMQGHWPWWMPEILGGMPGIAGTNLVFLHPIELALALMGAPVTSGFALDAAAEVALSGLGTYAFCRRLGLSHGASLLAGLSFAASGTQVSLLFAGHINNIKAIAMIPWAFWGAHKGQTERSWAGWGLGGAALALQILGIGMQIYAYTVPAVAAFAVWLAWRDPRGFKQAWLPAALGLSGGRRVQRCCSPRPSSSSSLQYKPYSWREGFSYDAFTSWSFHPKESLAWIVPGFYGWRSPTYHGDWPFCLTSEYFGLLPWALAAAAVAVLFVRKSAVTSAERLAQRPELFLLGLAALQFLGRHRQALPPALSLLSPAHLQRLPHLDPLPLPDDLQRLRAGGIRLGRPARRACRSARSRARLGPVLRGRGHVQPVGLGRHRGRPAKALAVRPGPSQRALMGGLALAVLFGTRLGLRFGALAFLLVALVLQGWDQSDLCSRYLDFRDPQEFLAAACLS